jgi:hypothetical protein
MAITQVGTPTSDTNTTPGNATLSISATIPAGASCCNVAIVLKADETMTSVEWSIGPQAFTQVGTSTSSGNAQDIVVFCYTLVNPTDGTGTITVTHSTTNSSCAAQVCYAGTVTTSAADACIERAEDVNNAPTSDTTLASSGTSGNALFGIAGFMGADGDPTSNSEGWTELFDIQSGTAGDDKVLYICEELTTVPDSWTVAWSATDENAGILMELIAAEEAGGGANLLTLLGVG